MIICCKNCGTKIKFNKYKGKRTDWKMFRFKYFKKYYNKYKKLKPSKIAVVRLIVSRKYFNKKREQLFSHNRPIQTEVHILYKLVTDPRQHECYNNII